MLSLKDTVRKLIVTATLAAVTTHFFTGCSNNQVTSSDLYAPELTYEVTSEAPPLTYEAPNPIITESDSDSFSIKYKYWYDNPEVKEAQESYLADSNSSPGSLTDKDFLNLPNLPIYRDSGGNEYIISGRTKVYLVDGKITGSEALLLRNELGNKVYTTPLSLTEIAAKLSDFDQFLKDNGITQPKTLEERQTEDSSADESKQVVGDKPIYVNNLQTDYTTANGMIPVSGIFQGVTGIGFLDMSKSATESTAKVTLYTAAGFIEVTFKLNGDKVDVSYSTGLAGTSLAVGEEYNSNGSTILLTADALERVLGYDVEVYDDFINVVTDNHDLFSSDTIVDYYESASSVDNTRNIESINDVDPANPIPVSKPESEVKAEEQNKPADNEDAPTASKPETTKTPDGKYDLADTDLVNSDGTYTQTDFDPDNIPAWSSVNEMTEEKCERMARRMEHFGTQSNPSKIPYSQITLENAAEAFPFVGYTGYFPGYYQILPTDSSERIALKVYSNLIGEDNSGEFPELIQYHNYKSEADYLAAVAKQEAEAEARRQEGIAADAGKEAMHRGEETIGGNLSEEEAWDFFSD